MVHPVLQRFNNFILVSISVLMLFHSMSLYAVPVADIEEEVQTEQAQDIDEFMQINPGEAASIDIYFGNPLHAGPESGKLFRESSLDAIRDAFFIV